MEKKLYVIVGLGRTGLSCVCYCLANNIPFAVTDANSHPIFAKELAEMAPDAEVAFGGLSEKLIKKASLLLVSPGVSLQEPFIKAAVEKGVPAVGDTELFVKLAKKPIIAITGSNAKSTVTSLIGNILRRAGKRAVVAGNIGIPVLDVLNDDEVDFYVIEFSSFQLERTPSLSPYIATVLNICEDHMDRYADLDEYIKAKQRVYRGCQYAIVNRGDDKTFPQEQHSVMISFGLSEPKEGEFGLRTEGGEEYLAFEDQCLMPVNQLKLPGQHNVLNALAAMAIVAPLHLNMVAVLESIREFSGLPHRCQVVREHAGLVWYNDSKGTNVGATLAALDGLGVKQAGRAKVILIAGGVGKGADFSLLRPVVKRFVRKVIVFGEAARQLEMVLRDYVEVERVSSLEAAVEAADLSAVRHDIVLFSPACASFDMFENFEHRGAVFEQLVEAL
jgi:UDP-N-acetylmuramoylalanine--D-glutamate ligase